MIKETIKYIDFDDTEKEETLYFNLTALEVADIQIELGIEYGLDEYIKTIVQQDADGRVKVDPKNNAKVWNLFKMIISKAYGEKTTDGRFVKNADIRDSFLATEAFSQLFIRLIKDPAEAEKFFSELVKVKGVPAAEDHKQPNA